MQHNKQYHRKVLLSSFHLNGHTIGFHPQTQKLEPPCAALLTAPQKSSYHFEVALKDFSGCSNYILSCCFSSS